MHKSLIIKDLLLDVKYIFEGVKEKMTEMNRF